MQVRARLDAVHGCAVIGAKAGHKPEAQTRPSPALFAAESMGSGVVNSVSPYPAPMPNFTRLGPARPEVAILIDAMLRAGEVVTA
jgi:hypothetical protein